MVKIVEGSSIFNDLPDYSVLLHQCNTKGWMGNGISKEIARRWPNAFSEYHDYCRWFQDGHEDDILGTFVGMYVDPKHIVCSAIAQKTVRKHEQQTDYDAWEDICHKIEVQTRAVKVRTGHTWTIHVPYNIGCGQGGGDWETMLGIFKKYFSMSTVDLIIHKY